MDLWSDDEPSTTSFKIWKKLQGTREDSLKDKAADNGNVMGVFQVGRREFGWDMPNVREERKQIQSRTPEEIKQIYGNSCSGELPMVPD